MERALYGLRQSLKRWANFRDERVRDMEWKKDGRVFWLAQSLADPNVWKVLSMVDDGEEVNTGKATTGSSSTARSGGAEKSTHLEGVVVVYVDDILIWRRRAARGLCPRDKRNVGDESAGED